MCSSKIGGYYACAQAKSNPISTSLYIEIVSAEKEIFTGEVKLVSVSGQMGEVGIAPGHTPFITRIKPGEIRVHPVDGKLDPGFFAYTAR